MRSKDLFYFLLACVVLIFVLWNFGPQPKPPKKDEDKDKDSNEVKLTLQQQQQLALQLPAVGNPLSGFGAIAFLLDHEDKSQPVAKVTKPEDYSKLTAGQKERRAQAAAMGFAGALTLFEASVPTIAAPTPKEVVLGSNDVSSPYQLRVTLSSKSAGVREVMLNRFEAATSDGKPDPEHRRLVLIPKSLEGHEARPSFVLYHYDHPDADNPRADLEDVVWNIVEQGKRIVGSDNDKKEIQVAVFQTEINGVRITKTFSLEPWTYHVGLEVKLERAPTTLRSKVRFRYQMTGGHGLPIEGRWYTDTFRTALIGYTEDGDFGRDHQTSSDLRGGSAVIERSQEQTPTYAAVMVQYFASAIVVDQEQSPLESARPTLEARVIKIRLDDDLKKLIQPGKDDPGAILLPDKDESDETAEALTFYLSPDQAEQAIMKKKGQELALLCGYDYVGNLRVLKVLSEGQAHPRWHDDVTVRVKSVVEELEAGKPKTHKYLLYHGPVKVAQLKQIAGATDGLKTLVDNDYVKKHKLNTLTDWHSPTAIGRFANAIFWSDLVIMFTNLLHGLFAMIYSVIGDNGICIVLLTIFVRLLMFPMSRKQALTGIKMQQLAPELKKLKEQYKEDRQRFASEMMALYRKHGVNPLGSCWLLLLQLPIFMGLYWTFRESIQFRLSSFLWIENLSAPDMLIYWSRSIPIISSDSSYGGLLYLGPYFNVLPILAITMMILQQKMMMPPPQDDQQAQQQKMMRYVMIVFAFVFYKVAAGLCIYFVASSLWGFAERKLLPKKDRMKHGDKPAELVVKKSADAFTEKLEAGKKGKDKQVRKGQKQVIGAKKGGNNSTGPLGWFGRARKRVKDWWEEVLDKAKKK